MTPEGEKKEEIKRAVQAYLQGGKGLREVAGMLQDMSPDDFRKLLNAVGMFGLFERKEALMYWFEHRDEKGILG